MAQESDLAASACLQSGEPPEPEAIVLLLDHPDNDGLYESG
jgi:hypothetical protein